MNSNPDPSSLTITKLYNPSECTGQTIQYKAYFDKFLNEFGANYQIWIKEDGCNKLAVGIVTDVEIPTIPTSVTIWLKYDNAPLQYDPLSSTVIEAARNHLRSSMQDLQINYPYKN